MRSASASACECGTDRRLTVPAHTSESVHFKSFRARHIFCKLDTDLLRLKLHILGLQTHLHPSTQLSTYIMADKPKEQVETAPDPDEDDLDDLDGMSLNHASEILYTS